MIPSPTVLTDRHVCPVCGGTGEWDDLTPCVVCQSPLTRIEAERLGHQEHVLAPGEHIE